MPTQWDQNFYQGHNFNQYNTNFPQFLTGNTVNSFNEYQKETNSMNENQGIISIPRKTNDNIPQEEEKKTENSIISNPKPNKPIPSIYLFLKQFN